MPQKQLFIHVGFHKSGTTALQESLWAQRGELKEQGILYPDIGRKAHHRLAWALTQKPWGWKNRGGEKTPAGVWDKMARFVSRSGSEKVVLSSEFFSELSIDNIQKIRGSIQGREVQVVFTLRPLAKLLGSSYQQYLKYGTKADYSEWLHSVLDEPGKSKINPTFWKRHAHGEVVARWVQVFGKDNVTVIVVDEKQPQLLFDSVNELLGLEKDFLKSQPTGSNRSLSMEEITLLLELNRKFPQERMWDEYLTFIRNGYVRQLTDYVPVAEGKAKLLTPVWAVEAANTFAASSKGQIRDLGVRVIGDLETLDKAEVATGEPEYPATIDIATVASAMLGMDRTVIRRFPLRWFVWEIKRRGKLFLSGKILGKTRL